MASKTWKIGEYCAGGILVAETTAKEVRIITKEWDFSKGSRKGSDQSGAKELHRIEVNLNDTGIERQLSDYLNEQTSSYYAEQVLDWVKTKVTFQPEFGNYFWGR